MDLKLAQPLHHRGRLFIKIQYQGSARFTFPVRGRNDSRYSLLKPCWRQSLGFVPVTRSPQGRQHVGERRFFLLGVPGAERLPGEKAAFEYGQAPLFW